MSRVSNLAINSSGFAFDPNNGASYNLNSLGAKIIDYIKEELEIDDITKRIVDEYEVEYNEAYIDILDFTKKLKLYGLT